MKGILVILSLGLFVSAKSFGTTITIDGSSYDVSLEFNYPTGDFLTTLQNNPWWGNSIKSRSAATQVANSLGMPNTLSWLGGSPSGYGPIFAWDKHITSRDMTNVMWYILIGDPSYGSGGIVSDQAVPESYKMWYAVATPSGVPDTGTTILLLGSSLILLVGVRRKFMKR